MEQPKTGDVLEPASKMVKGPHGHWLPGQSGNPRGRPPKGLSFVEKLRRRIDDEAEILIEVALNEAKQGNSKFWDSIMDRALGKPVMTVERTDDERQAAYEELQLTLLAKLAERRLQGQTQAQTPARIAEPSAGYTTDTTNPA